ncbi:MAG: tRNA (adenosine(37)-N6)-dimethylallyltransferase MiaA [Acidimicrobiia bacterium]|nr:tRNA (adenosine(37)-N6)-dimethylallyltransferase MiaA [Acidimicrobiia bacterium]
MLGPTASGKSDVALRLAEDLGAEIISVDSMQVYRRMDIGTAKATLEERKRVRHHGLDLVEPSGVFSVAEYQQIGRAVMENSSVPLVIVGGSGLHFRALVDPLRFRPHDAALKTELEALSPEESVARLKVIDEMAAGHIDLANPRRVTRALEIAELTGETPSSRAVSEEQRSLDAYHPLFAFKAIALDPGPGLARRVTNRLKSMVDAGLVEEVAGLAAEMGRTARQAVGYKELLPVVAGETSLAEGIEAARRATLALVKRQRTYFRRDPRLKWLTWSDDADERYRLAAAGLRS